MKNFLVLSVLVSGVLFAEGVTNSEQVKTMQSLEKSMGEIQKGFLYNNSTLVDTAVKNLKKTLLDLKLFKIEEKKDDKKFNPKKYVATEAKDITNLVDKLDKSYKDGKKDEALETYSKTLNRCVVCHKLVRKW